MEKSEEFTLIARGETKPLSPKDSAPFSNSGVGEAKKRAILMGFFYFHASWRFQTGLSHYHDSIKMSVSGSTRTGQVISCWGSTRVL